MRMGLFPFQEDALAELNKKIDRAHRMWSEDEPQVVSFSAPTGSGKTIIMTALFEEILFGNADRIADPDAIFVWLSDSPMLNEQTRFKIERESDKIKVRDLVTVDANFDAEFLEGGHIYFLNTQKLGSDKLLTARSDVRQYPIWETLTNTARKYPDKLYIVIDEAHRGTATSERDVNKAHSIMQKFIKGSDEDGMIPMPLVIGVSATPQRFENMLDSPPHKVYVPVSAVRDSGLLKDRIIIRIPDTPLAADMTILRSAVENWREKCRHWDAYSEQQRERDVNPILVVQVEDGSGAQVTGTDIDICLSLIEEAMGRRLLPGEAVHTFNGYDILNYGGMELRYVEASRIEEDPNIKVVFFKMNLSTGWDCPRAETMMSFRSAQDYTFIAQLLGRMIRTPLARHIDSDAELNNVSLYLPYFDEQTVGKVIEALRDDESAAPAEVGTGRELVTLKRNPAFADVFDATTSLVTCRIDSARKQTPIRLYLGLARNLTMDGIDLQIQRSAKNMILSKMVEEIDSIKASGTFDERVKAITGYSEGALTFNYGDTHYIYDEKTRQVDVMDYDIRRHFEQAGKILGEGLHTEYWIKNSTRDENDIWVEIIILASDTDAMERLNAFAQTSFADMYEEYKHSIRTLPEARKQTYKKLTSASPQPVYIPWELPQAIDFTVSENIRKYEKHLYVNGAGEMETALGAWEDGVLREELQNGAVCWLRNLDRKPWSLCIPYEVNGVFTPMYPDLLIVRAVRGSYVFDVLEPHDGSRKDNCPKAVGLAKFADQHWDKFGRIELIREMRGPDGQMHFYRLDMGKAEVRNRVRGITANAELDRIFEEIAVRED